MTLEEPSRLASCVEIPEDTAGVPPDEGDGGDPEVPQERHRGAGQRRGGTVDGDQRFAQGRGGHTADEAVGPHPPRRDPGVLGAARGERVAHQGIRRQVPASCRSPCARSARTRRPGSGRCRTPPTWARRRRWMPGRAVAARLRSLDGMPSGRVSRTPPPCFTAAGRGAEGLVRRGAGHEVDGARPGARREGHPARGDGHGVAVGATDAAHRRGGRRRHREARGQPGCRCRRGWCQSSEHQGGRADDDHRRPRPPHAVTPSRA